MNHRKLRDTIFTLALTIVLAACSAAPGGAGLNSGSTKAKSYKDLVVGYAQIGAESEWRTANTISIQETARDLGVELKFSDGQQQQENQIKAIRSFIAQRVDVIGVSPAVEKGWDPVLKEVKQAGIPLIMLDRH